MPRAVDHLVMPARDLDAQAEFFRRLGFQVGARNRHPWGTENHIVQFDGAFLELIGLGEGFAAPAPAPGEFSFAGSVADYLARREGIAMLVGRSASAEADRARFAAEGLGDFKRFDFARKATKPDGSVVEVAFSLAFASCAALPETGFFVCEQRFPENFWSRSAQVHPNGATAIAGVAITHDRPDEAVEFLTRFLDAPALANAGGFAAGPVECLTPAAFARAFGVDRFATRGIAAIRIGVADLAVAEPQFARGGVHFVRSERRLIVDAFGAVIAFEPSAAA
jgi:catechol 2,3-dioxygenase-like lactoylglutathione lyase family enzyme